MIRLFLITTLAAVLTLSCGSEPAGHIEADIDGIWFGIAELTSPGPDDAPVSTSVEVQIRFDDGSLTIWSPAASELYITISGAYRVSGNSIEITELVPMPPTPTLQVLGHFDVIRTSDLLHLHQEIGNDLFIVERDLVLQLGRDLSPTG